MISSPSIPLGTACQRRGMAQARAFSTQAAVNIFDVPLSYDPPIGPTIDFRVNYTASEVRNARNDRLSEPDSDQTVAPVMRAVKEPLSSKITYVTEGQTDPSLVGTSNLPTKVMRAVSTPAGTKTQTYSYEYNEFGKLTKAVDPIGRISTFKYATNNIDLLEACRVVAGNSVLLSKWVYNDRHLPISYTDGAGHSTTYSYSGFGGIEAIRDAGNQTWTFGYDQ